MTYDNLKTRAEAIRAAYAAGSITPEMVGSLFADLADYVHTLRQEATLFGGVVQNATITQAGVTALNTDVIVWNVATGQFLLRRGFTCYDAWAASTDGTVGDANSWAAKRTAGRRFYTDMGDGTMKWFYYDGAQMLETMAETDAAVTEVLTDHESRIKAGENGLAALNRTVLNLGEFASVSAGLAAAAQSTVASNLAVRLITFSVPSLNQSVNVLQQHFGSLCTQIVLAEGNTRVTYIRSITTGGNYSVGALQQLHLYTKMAVENGMLVGYTMTPTGTQTTGNFKRVEICSLTETTEATAETNETDETTETTE